VGVPSFTSPPPVPDADANDADSEDTEHDSDDIHVKSLGTWLAQASKTQTLEDSDIPMSYYDYFRVLGVCCENVVGYIPLPLGIASL
jgi:hydroxymethylglutaryl-CoA reductase